MKRSAIFLSFLFSFFISPFALQAQVPTIDMTVLFPKTGSSLTVTLTPSSNVAGCVAQFHSSSRISSLNAPNDSTLIASGGTQTTGPITFSATRLRAMWNRGGGQTVGLRARLLCAGGESLSKLVKIKPRRDSRGRLKSTGEWVKQLKPRITTRQTNLQIAFPNLTFDQPIALENAGDGSNRLYIAEQGGKIYVIPNNTLTTTKILFLDLSSKLLSTGERGLLGLAFHPQYKTNGFVYVHYSKAGSGDTVIARYTVTPPISNEASLASELVLLEQTQAFSNHNGGEIAFGNDGFLYIGLGDGGSSGDPQGNGQNGTTLLGKILRIDVNNTEAGKNYAIPADNPYKGNTGGIKEEIYALGFRNPWRFSFDPANGNLWVGDVGQSTLEEVDVVEKGKNYGWNTMEGSSCYNATTCNQTGLTLPITEYPRSVGQSITGGQVYRGTNNSFLSGKYIFADFITGVILSLPADGSTNVYTQLYDTSHNISSFGVDESNELYLLTYNDGKIWQLK